MRVCVCLWVRGRATRAAPSKFSRILPGTVPHPLPSLEDVLGMAHGRVKRPNTVPDTAGINTWVTNKCVVKGTLIGSFVRRLSLWQRRETFVSLFHRWPHRASDGSPPPRFNRPEAAAAAAAAQPAAARGRGHQQNGHVLLAWLFWLWENIKCRDESHLIDFR